MSTKPGEDQCAAFPLSEEPTTPSGCERRDGKPRSGNARQANLDLLGRSADERELLTRYVSVGTTPGAGGKRVRQRLAKLGR